MPQRWSTSDRNVLLGSGKPTIDHHPLFFDAASQTREEAHDN